MKIAILLSLPILLLSAAPNKHVFTTFMPQEHEIISVKDSSTDTAKNVSKTVIIIKKIDENGNESEIVHEFRGMNLSMDSIREQLMNRFSFDGLPEALRLDTFLNGLRVKMEKLGNTFPNFDTLFENRFEERISFQFPDIELENFKVKFKEFQNNWGHTKTFSKNILIHDLDKKELKDYNAETNTLQLDQFAYYPNPNRGDLTIEFATKQKKPVTIKIYDLIGRVWYDEQVAAYDGKYNKSLPIVLSPGMYLLRIEQTGKTVTKKIVVE